MQSWDSWGADDASFSNGPNSYGDSRYAQRPGQTPEDEPEIDFFQDMTPDFKKAAKVRSELLCFWCAVGGCEVEQLIRICLLLQIVIRKKEENYHPSSGLSSRLAFTSDIPTQVKQCGLFVPLAGTALTKRTHISGLPLQKN